MQEMQVNEGEALAKVLWYYNLIPSVSTPVQKIVCPFHDDVNPSMRIDLKAGRWFCFGCGLTGDAKRFVKEMEKKYHGANDLLAYSRYLKILKSKKCSDIHVLRSMLEASVKPSKELYNEAYDYYHGLSKVIWEKPSDIEEVSSAREYMKKRGFSPKTLTKAKAKVTYNQSYGLIFPMLDNGKFRGWVCRTMRADIEKKRKYLYNEGFSRYSTLVGNYGSEDYVFVVEGYMDMLKFVQFGVTNVVAILGWKMSAEQEKKLKEKGVKRVISALDNDECGIKGTKYLQTVFEVTRFRYLKGVKDPGEMDKATFQKCYNKTMSDFRGTTR